MLPRRTLPTRSISQKVSPTWLVGGALLVSFAHAQVPESTPPAPTSPAPAQPAPAESVAKPKDIISIARAEAERESASLHGRIKTLLGELSLRTDENDPFVANRVAEIAQIGSLALEDLLKAMDPPAAERSNGVMNTALNASRAIAKMPGQAVTAAIVRLAREGGPHGRRSAATAIGLRGDPSLAPVVRELCSKPAEQEKSVVAEAIRAVAILGGPDAAPALDPFIDSAEPSHAARAIDGLALLKDKSFQPRITSRLAAEYSAAQPSDPVLRACLDYVAVVPNSDTLELAGRAVTDPLRAAETRAAAARALRVIATKVDGTKKKSLNYLDDAVRTSTGILLEQIAYEMRELGDGSGVDAVVEPLDKQVKDDPKNFGLRYQRGEVFLRLKEYPKARRDFSDGLKLERDPRQPERIYIALARCSAAVNEEREAEKYLLKLESILGDQDFSTLPKLYQEFVAMANDSRFNKLFAPAVKSGE